MKKQIEFLIYIFAVLVISILILSIIEKTKKIVKTETVNCEYVLQIDIGTDTVRTIHKDQLTIITGRSNLREDYNVKLSELIDSQLLTKPKSVTITGYIFKTLTLQYDKIRIEYYNLNEDCFVFDNNNKILYSPVDFNKHREISEETEQNINVIIKRYLQ